MKRLFVFLTVSFGVFALGTESDAYREIPFGCPDGYRIYQAYSIVRVGQKGGYFPVDAPQSDADARAQTVFNLLNLRLSAEVLREIDSARNRCYVDTLRTGIFKVHSRVVLSTGAIQPVIRLASPTFDRSCFLIRGTSGFVSCNQMAQADAACCVRNDSVLPGFNYPVPLPYFSTDTMDDFSVADNSGVQIENYDGLVALEEPSEIGLSNLYRAHESTVDEALSSLPLLQQFNLAEILSSF